MSETLSENTVGDVGCLHPHFLLLLRFFNPRGAKGRRHHPRTSELFTKTMMLNFSYDSSSIRVFFLNLDFSCRLPRACFRDRNLETLPYLARQMLMFVLMCCRSANNGKGRLVEVPRRGIWYYS